jgi:hypothetical protein
MLDVKPEKTNSAFAVILREATDPYASLEKWRR